MKYTRSRIVGEVVLFETFKGDVNEIAELSKALASHKALTVKPEFHVHVSGSIDTTRLSKALKAVQNINKDVEKKVDEFTQWSTEIAKLAKRNIDIGLLKELNSLGPKCLKEILALNSLTNEKFDEYCELYREKEKLSFEQFNMI
ncbi:hypothetical protein [Lysinibacillus sp. NPDC093692]|uniref:hypothetical protein n=1 Tax=Lysinibacillus sp. NPDC093692 TaxID=3390578 RepID=UPI003D079E1F